MIMNKVLKEEIDDYIMKHKINLENNCKFIITGATGFIGSTLVSYLIRYRKIKKINIDITIFVRNIEKAKNKFGGSVKYISSEQDISKLNIEASYLIHCIDNTSSQKIKDYPVNTLMDSVTITNTFLDFSRKNKLKSVVYLSSVEVYGEINKKTPIIESDLGKLDIYNPRNSYSIGKRASEHLCYSYFKQYDLPIKIIRLAQVAGPGFNEDDNRLFPYLSKIVMKNDDIVLNTAGKSMKDYIYIMDAVEGILFILTNGINGEVYNMTNSDNSHTVLEIAEIFSAKIKKNVKFKIINNGIYPKESRLLLDDSKMKKLGYTADKNVDYIINRMLKYLKEEEKK